MPYLGQNVPKPGSEITYFGDNNLLLPKLMLVIAKIVQNYLETTKKFHDINSDSLQFLEKLDFNWN